MLGFIPELVVVLLTVVVIDRLDAPFVTFVDWGHCFMKLFNVLFLLLILFLQFPVMLECALMLILAELPDLLKFLLFGDLFLFLRFTLFMLIFNEFVLRGLEVA